MIFKNLYEELFYKSLRIRLVEEKIIELYPYDKIQSPVHLSIGQEAIAVGACHNLHKRDLLFSTYRGHAFYLAKGGDLKQFFAELYGKKNGCCQGKAGSMHLASAKIGMMGSSAIVASTISHAVGAAFAAQKLKKNQIVITAFGDGATDEGVIHESLNFAALHKIPVIFLYENNDLAVNSFRKTRQSFSIIEIVKQYKGIRTWSCNEGYDPLKVYHCFQKVIKTSRKTKSPQFIEIKTYRFKEHVGIHDDFDAGYRSINDFKNWQKNDPLIQNKILFSKFESTIMKEIHKAVKFAEISPWPDHSDLFTDVI